MHILLIDNNPVEYELLKEQLVKGIHLSSCYTSEQAIEMIKGKEFNLVLVDVMLGDESGFEVATKIEPYLDNILLISDSFSNKEPVCMNNNTFSISKSHMSQYINEKVFKHGRIER